MGITLNKWQCETWSVFVTLKRKLFFVFQNGGLKKSSVNKTFSLLIIVFKIVCNNTWVFATFQKKTPYFLSTSKKQWHTCPWVFKSIFVENNLIVLKRRERWHYYPFVSESKTIFFSWDEGRLCAAVVVVVAVVVVAVAVVGVSAYLNALKMNFQSLKLSCHSRFQRAFTSCSCVFKVIALVWANQRNFFENATACSKRIRKTLVATQL